jgi:hypothetical protein
MCGGRFSVALGKTEVIIDLASLENETIKKKPTLTLTFQYDFLIVSGLTIITGTALKRIAFAGHRHDSKLDRLFPFALVYFPLAIIYAFITDELPLRCFSFDPILNAPGSGGLGPQSINSEGLIAAGTYILTVVINLSAWLFSLYIITRHFLKRKRIPAPSESLTNESKSFLEE